MITFTLPLTPVAKARHRTTKKGHVYTPTKTAVFEEHVALLSKKHFPSPLTGPLAMEIFCLFGRTSDSLTGIAYRDDNQICECHIIKAYTEKALAAKIVVSLSEIDAPEEWGDYVRCMVEQLSDSYDIPF